MSPSAEHRVVYTGNHSLINLPPSIRDTRLFGMEMSQFAATYGKSLCVNAGHRFARRVYDFMDCSSHIDPGSLGQLLDPTRPVTSYTPQMILAVAPTMHGLSSANFQLMVDRAKQELRAAGKPFLPAALPEPPPMHDQVGPAQMQLDQQSGGVLDVILSNCPNQLVVAGSPVYRALLQTGDLYPAEEDAPHFQLMIIATSVSEGYGILMHLMHLVVCTLSIASCNNSPFGFTILVCNPSRLNSRFIRLEICLRCFPDVLSVLNAMDYNCFMFAYGYVNNCPEFFTNRLGALYKHTGVAVMCNDMSPSIERLTMAADFSNCVLLPRHMVGVQTAGGLYQSRFRQEKLSIVANGAGCSFVASEHVDVMMAFIAFNKHSPSYAWAVDAVGVIDALDKRLASCKAYCAIRTAGERMLARQATALMARYGRSQALGECVSCMEAAPAVTLAPCSHRVLCRPCALIWVFRNRMTCPMCRGVVHSCSISKTELQNQR